MTAITALWLPVVVSVVIVFVASSIIHMGPLWHRGDYPRVPDQEAARSALRALAIPPGEYMIPRAASAAEWNMPEFRQQMKEGPVAILTVVPPGDVAMGRRLLQWTLYCLAVSIFTAYITGVALPPETGYLRVFRIAGASAFCGYALALWQMSIWYSRSWSSTLKATLDGLIYALLTAGTFGWLWPGAAA